MRADAKIAKVTTLSSPYGRDAKGRSKAAAMDLRSISTIRSLAEV